MDLWGRGLMSSQLVNLYVVGWTLAVYIVFVLMRPTCVHALCNCSSHHSHPWHPLGASFCHASPILGEWDLCCGSFGWPFVL